ncbi:hypothetical protein HPB51_014234 [Rhipicephalus microplus]|uniref:Uncharacterized protein n=1 Tax=Rhipicephalus microplus TaxID=6941 RepID=A0A9J6D5C7_RHIMP|nr:hypothetical protein HPB51_014234 [Rhipicephalus microplus]
MSEFRHFFMLSDVASQSVDPSTNAVLLFGLSNNVGYGHFLQDDQEVASIVLGEHDVAPIVLVFKVLPRCFNPEDADAERIKKKSRLLNRKLTATLKRWPCVRILNAESKSLADWPRRGGLVAKENMLWPHVHYLFKFLLPEHRFLNYSKEPRRALFAFDGYHVDRAQGINQLAKIIVASLVRDFGLGIQSHGRSEPGARYRVLKCSHWNTKGNKSWECSKFLRLPSHHGPRQL